MKLVPLAAVLLLASAAAVPSADAQTTAAPVVRRLAPRRRSWAVCDREAPRPTPYRFRSSTITRALGSINLGVLNAEEGVGRAQGARWTALPICCPTSAGVSENRQKVNLAAFGFPASGVPSLVGPFNVFLMRG